ncbi:MAG: sugar ABC transporter permease [Lachnospiraceae bacterium]|nr:sugar ABC transporter permease [Lachnospiraceae bacterium]
MRMKKKKKYTGLQQRKAIAGYLFILPFIIGFLVFMVQPLFQSLYMSFSKVELGAGSVKMNFDGLSNYIRAFTVDTEFNRMLTEEIGRMSYNALAIMVFSFFVALILNQKFKGRAFVRAIFFLPVILSSGVILGVETNNSLLSDVQGLIKESTGNTSISGVIETILETSGVGGAAFEIVFDIVNGIYDVALASGIQIIIFLSGLQTISTSMYEAAEIDGCTKWESLWKITFPMISPLLIVNWIYTIVDFCMRSDNEVIEKISETMIVNLNYGFASSMAWIYFVIVIAIIGISSLIISKGVYYYE